MEHATTLVAGVVGVLLVLALADNRVASNPITYVIFAALMIIWMVAKTPGPTKSLSSKVFELTKRMDEGPSKLGDKEGKFLVFYILTQLEKKQHIELSELATDLNVSIYELNKLVQLLGKKGVVEVVYPPMQNFPLLMQGDYDKSRKYRRSIYAAYAKNSIPGEPKLEEFAKEVGEYLETIRRRKEK
jgi:hypothetical protein